MPGAPGFPVRLVGVTDFMRLSLLKAAHATTAGAAVGNPGSLPLFFRQGWEPRIWMHTVVYPTLRKERKGWGTPRFSEPYLPCPSQPADPSTARRMTKVRGESTFRAENCGSLHFGRDDKVSVVALHPEQVLVERTSDPLRSHGTPAGTKVSAALSFRSGAGSERLARRNSLQFCVLRFRLIQDGDVGISVFPEGEKVLIGSLRLDLISRHHERSA